METLSCWIKHIRGVKRKTVWQDMGGKLKTNMSDCHEEETD